MVHGFVPGVVATARDPIKTAKAVGSSYKKQYTPLVRQVSAQLHGDWDEAEKWRTIADQSLYDHPLGPIFDLLTVASVGTGAAVKAGLAPSTAGKSIRLTLANGKVVERGISAKPLRGYTQVALDAGLKKVTKQEWNRVGEFARAVRVENRITSRAARANEQHVNAFYRVIGRLKSDQEKVAVYMLATLPDPDDLAAQTKHLEDAGNVTEAALRKDPKMLEMYNNPSAFPKVQSALKAIDDLSNAKRKILGTTLGDAAAAARPFLHTRIARGARFFSKKDAASRIRQLDSGLASLERELVRLDAAGARTHARYSRLSSQEFPRLQADAAVLEDSKLFLDDVNDILEDAKGAHVQGDLTADDLAALLDEAEQVLVKYERALSASDSLAQKKAVIQQVIADGAKLVERQNVTAETIAAARVIREQIQHDKGSFIGGPSIDEIKAGLAAKGRPEPLYLPDVMAQKNVTLGAMNAGGTGLPRSAVKQNQGVLFLMDKLIMDPSVAGPAFMSAVKYAHHVDLYNRLVGGARVLLKDHALPDGYQFLRRPVRPVEAVIDGRRQIIGNTPEKIGYVPKHLDSYEKWLDDLRSGKQLADEEPPAGDPFTTNASVPSEVTEAAVEGGFLIVPKSYAKAMAGEFTRSQGFIYWLNRKPMRVWRSLVLNLRPAWLVNNILGNTFMYTLYNASPQGVVNLVSALKRMAPPAEAKEFDALMYRHFGNQLNATFIGSQRPSNMITKGIGASKKRRVAAAGEKVVESLANVDKAYESALRRAAVRTALQKNPALRQAVKDLRSETKDFYEAASKVLDADPVLVQQIEDRVYAALGNFVSLGKFEKEAVRSVFPFYAWYRAIVEVAVKLPLEQPAKLALFARIGEIGAEKSLADLGVTEDEVPPWARALIPLGPKSGGRVPVLNTQSANPFGTVADISRFGGALVAGGPGSVGRTLPGANPLVIALLALITGRNPQTGAPLPDRLGGGNIAAAGESVFMNLPQVKMALTMLGENYKGKPGRPNLYDHNTRDDILRYLGVPKADVSVLALKQKKEKDSKPSR